MSDESSNHDDGGGGERVGVNEEQRQVSDVAVELATVGETAISISRSLYGAARDSDRAEFLRLREVSKKLRGTLVDLEAQLDELSKGP